MRYVTNAERISRKAAENMPHDAVRLRGEGLSLSEMIIGGRNQTADWNATGNRQLQGNDKL